MQKGMARMKCLIGAIVFFSRCFLPSFWLSIQVSQLSSTLLPPASLLSRLVRSGNECSMAETTMRSDPAAHDTLHGFHFAREEVEEPVEHPYHLICILRFHQYCIRKMREIYTAALPKD